MVKSKIKEKEAELKDIIKKEAEKRMEILKKTGTLPNDIAENIRNLIRTSRQYKYFNIYINLLKQGLYNKNTKNFEYTFHNFSDDNQNFILINYELFGDLFYETNKKVCEKYNFLDYKKIILLENDKTVFSSENNE